MPYPEDEAPLLDPSAPEGTECLTSPERTRAWAGNERLEPDDGLLLSAGPITSDGGALLPAADLSRGTAEATGIPLRNGLQIRGLIGADYLANLRRRVVSRAADLYLEPPFWTHGHDGETPPGLGRLRPLNRPSQ